MTRVSLQNIDRHYGALHALRDVSFEVEDGEFVVLLGPSGCGKSTLLSSIAGLDPLQGGQILFDDQDVSRLEPAQRNIGMVFQSYALYPSMKVRSNLSFGLESQRMSRAKIDERVGWAAQLLQIEPLLDRRPAALSGGQRQRVAIGRALVRDTDLFLFDEPLSNLDAKLRTEMRVEIKALHKRLGATFIYVTHDQVEAMTLATRIAVMNGGRLEQYDTPETVYERPASTFVASFIGAPPMNLLPARVVRGDGGAVAEVQGARLPIPSGIAAQVEGEVTLGVRCEALTVMPAGSGGPEAFTGSVVVTEPLGADTLVWVEVGEHRLCARIPPRDARSLPGEVALAPASGALSFFHPESGQRIPGEAEA
ncbi:ABC transporter ATP-binding protein [Pseudoroseicyclus tamaricis]|uniref:sn-glycerol-3-phosphate ABC transporter ATP-binding protein UgpC n=1 Tax=Pseudoroseicyclus tamaricis TaxID=2705421 RepID=A0A6B2JSW8_9RHOB|nr:sn-glycerol-3-phosphate ABC transporter ATP-binding protein UgpC [Pseudoroseicyclus tamaricis]NDV01328.1 sn-glycerol-3-phosphate ABC transporter ATP-binding protein UgpC [Pseudoroseicyclus tamaricis]